MDDIILIILDTLRKDYGEKYLNPILRRYGFVYYSNAIAPSPWTFPSHVSIFTGKYPAIHGVHETRDMKIPKIRIREHSRFLTTQLSGMGYNTVLISANSLIQPNFGFRGFNEVYDIFWYPEKLSHKDVEIIKKYKSKNSGYLSTAINLIYHRKFEVLWRAVEDVILYKKILSRIRRYPPLDKGINKAISILKNLDLKDKNFIVINLMEVHEPYSMKYPALGGIVTTLTGKVTKELIEDWRKGYQKEAEYLRNKLEILLGILKQKGLFENSLVIITSDHGQLLGGENNRLGHGVFLDDELIRVPLWIKYPDALSEVSIDNTSEESAQYISLIRLYNTIIEAAIGDGASSLSDKIVFSETYGNPSPIPSDKLSPELKSRIEDIEKHRIAIYYKNFKGIFNVTDWKFEEIKSYDPNIKVTEDVVKHMKKEVVKFLKTATVAKVPKIKL